MKRISLTAMLGLVFIFAMGVAQARPHHQVTQKRVTVERKVVVQPASARIVGNYLTSLRISVLPRGHRHVVHGGNTYYYHNGVYYLSEKGGYVVVKPVPGLREVTVIRHS